MSGIINYNNLPLQENYIGKTRGEIFYYLSKNNFSSQFPEMHKIRIVLEVAAKALVYSSIISILLCAAAGTGILEAHVIWGFIPLGLSGGGLVTLAVTIAGSVVYSKLRKQRLSDTEVTNLRNGIDQSLKRMKNSLITDN